MSKFIDLGILKRLALVTGLIVAVDLIVLFDVPVLRPVLGFCFLLFVPGYIILFTLKSDNLRVTEIVVLSLGLSMFFLMFSGVLIDWLYPLLGYDTPISTNSLVITLSIILFFLTYIASLRNHQFPWFFNWRELNLSRHEKTCLAIPAVFPLLSFTGMHIMNLTDNNLLLILLLVLICAYILFVAIWHKNIPERILPPVLLMISISLLSMLALRSSHIIGIDIHAEYYVFQQTYLNEKWSLYIEGDPTASCLSVSLLPAIYQLYVNIDLEYLFKILYPLLFSFSPLVIYLIARNFLGTFPSFAAALFFISQSGFLTTASNARTNIAILFFALAIMIMFHRGVREFNRTSLFVIFFVSCVFSHYSTSYLLLGVLLATYISVLITKWIIRIIRKSRKMKDDPTHANSFVSSDQTGDLKTDTSVSRNMINAMMVTLLFAWIFLWNAMVASAPFERAVDFVIETASSMKDFFLMEQRGQQESAFGIGIFEKTIPQQMEFVFSWLTIALIGIGIPALWSKYRHLTGLDKKEESIWLPGSSDVFFSVLPLSCAAILFFSVVAPFVFTKYSMDRMYLQMLVVIAPFFVIGGMIIARNLRIKHAYLVILLVLLPFFMSTTGLTYEFFNSPREITLNSEGEMYDDKYLHDEEVYASIWLAEKVSSRDWIWCDWLGSQRLISHGGLIEASYAYSLIEDAGGIGEYQKGYFFLRYFGVTQYKLQDSHHDNHWIKDYQQEFLDRNIIYGNSGAMIYGD